VKVHHAALKHAIPPEDSIFAAENAVYVSDLDEESPARQFRLGFIAAETITPGSTTERRSQCHRLARGGGIA
jgi:hypothetical protein